MKRRNTRMLTLRLDIVEDADIIAWLESLPEGSRSQAVRDVLRGGMGRESAQVDSVLDLEGIRSVVAEELDRMLAGRQLAVREEEGQAPDDIEAEQKYGDKLDQMLGGFQNQPRDEED